MRVKIDAFGKLALQDLCILSTPCVSRRDKEVTCILGTNDLSQKNKPRWYPDRVTRTGTTHLHYNAQNPHWTAHRKLVHNHPNPEPAGLLPPLLLSHSLPQAEKPTVLASCLSASLT